MIEWLEAEDQEREEEDEEEEREGEDYKTEEEEEEEGIPIWQGPRVVNTPVWWPPIDESEGEEREKAEVDHADAEVAKMRKS